MKKKAAKKAGKKTGKKTSVDITIELIEGKIPESATAHKNGTAGTPDRVRWWNRTKRGRTIVFDLLWWPFVESPSLINVDAHKKTGWFNISVDAVSSGYPYAVAPSLVTGKGPSEPAIIVED